MPDGGYGPDFLSRSMFFREAEGGPTQQELATMTAPFGGSPEQAMALLQSPEVQQRLQHFGLGGFNPSQIRQSPFLPNQFMQRHPMMGGALNSAMANVAATPEAPMVSGAGSGMSRAMQGMMGGPELLRQYQVRQLMAPFQAMGMQLPVMAEQRRQQLLQSLEQDMNQRRQLEQQKTPADKIRDDIYSPPGSPGYFTRGQQVPPQLAGQTPEQSGVASHPLFNLFGKQGQDQGQPFPQSGQVQFHPYDPSQVAAYSHAKDPQKQATADWRQAQIDAGMPEAEVDKYLAQAAAARQGGRGSKGKDWEKEYRTMDENISKQIRAYESAIADPKATEEQKNVYRMQIDQLNQQREQEKSKIDEARGAPGASVPYQPNQRYNPANPGALPPNSPSTKPSAQTGPGGQQGGAGAQQSQGTAVQKPDYVY